MLDNLNLEHSLVERAELDENDPDVKKIMKVVRKTLELMPDIHTINERMGTLKSGEKDIFLDKIIVSLKRDANFVKHWDAA